ncbi:MAG TPA: hypothetical protein VEU06_10120, partial [Micropepsaceae bacterium]|nr:hypothetical protein [Micropepsaceae bacterium]
ALRLARDPAALSEIKAKLARNLKTTTLFDTKLYTCNLEKAFVEMCQRSRNGEPAKGFEV